MRDYLTLETVSSDADSGIFSICAEASAIDAQIMLRREGTYIAISASYGPLEIALRPRYDALTRTLARLRPIGGLQTTRELGSTHAFISVGLKVDGSLVLRPTVVGDASGHIALNFCVTDTARQALYDWLGVSPE